MQPNNESTRKIQRSKKKLVKLIVYCKNILKVRARTKNLDAIKQRRPQGGGGEGGSNEQLVFLTLSWG